MISLAGILANHVACFIFEGAKLQTQFFLSNEVGALYNPQKREKYAIFASN